MEKLVNDLMELTDFVQAADSVLAELLTGSDGAGADWRVSEIKALLTRHGFVDKQEEQ